MMSIKIYPQIGHFQNRFKKHLKLRHLGQLKVYQNVNAKKENKEGRKKKKTNWGRIKNV